MMGTIADKLTLLSNTKKEIRAAIEEKGQTVADTDPFSSYPEKIRAIDGGGEAVPEPTVEERLYPYAVYRATRPTDWPEMPEPGENEICIYVRRDAEGVEEAVNKILYGMDIGGNGIIEISYLHNPDGLETGVPDDSYNWDGKKVSYPCESGKKYTIGQGANEFNSEDNIIRIHFNGTLEYVGFSAEVSNGVCEIWCNLPDDIDFKMAASVSPTSCLVPNLKYFKRLGAFATGNFAFTGCKNLISVLKYPTLRGRTQSNMFYGCENLEAVSPLMLYFDSDLSVSAVSMIRNASKLKNFPLYGLKVSKLSAASFAQNCSSLQRYPQVILDKAASFVPAAINGCTSLRELRFTNKFALPSSGVMSELEILTFNPETTTKAALTVNIPKMGYINFKTMLLSLPQNTGTTDATKSLTVTLNDDTKAQVTDDDYAICTEKGWILTIT